MYNFDDIQSRHDTASIKYDRYKWRGLSSDMLPLWIADMDFKVPDEVTNALMERVQHGIYGYSHPTDQYYSAVCNWFRSRYKMEFDKNEIVMTPGIIFAINLVIRTLTAEGDSILVQKPVYYPFFNSINNNKRKVINNPLININGRYEIDFEDFEQKIIDNHVKLFILCSPHNPVGRVWTHEELRRMGDICLQNDVIVISDEIHCDFTYGENVHIPFVNVREEFKNITVTCTAPSKTFNLAGLQISNNIVYNKAIRDIFYRELENIGYDESGIMALIACQAAYEHGSLWLEELKEYLIGNIEFVKEYLEVNLPQVKLIYPEGTYLAWLDFRELKFTPRELDRHMVYNAKLWLDGGTMFGEEGAGYQRVNVATSREMVKNALDSIKNSLDALNI